jgi:hypothetical protein
VPRSLTSAVEDLARAAAPAKDAPTRYDLYDLQKSVDALTEALGCRRDDDELRVQVGELGAQVEALGKAVAELTATVTSLAKVVAKLTRRLP